MDINKHICFRFEEAPELALYLRGNNLGEEVVNMLGDMFYLDILTQSPHWPYVAEQVETNKLFCLTDTYFTEQERLQAQWLEVRSTWRFDYPQPQQAFLNGEVTYAAQSRCDLCGSGMKQFDDFRMKKSPKWGKRYFCQVNWVEDELFTNNVGKAILETVCPDAVSFRNVKDKRGQENWSDFYQLVIPFVLEKGLVADHPSVKSYQKCPCCGVVKYLGSGFGMHQFKRDTFTFAPDMVKTGEIFGSGHLATRYILISQKLYRILTAERLTRNLAFRPIELVD